MSAPVINPAGNVTPGRLQTVDINLTAPLNVGAPNWQTIQYVESIDFNPDAGAFVDATVYGDGGYSGQEKLGAAWSLTAILNHMSVPGSNPPAYDPTHDFLEGNAVGVFGAGNRVQLRIYDWDVNDVTGIVTPRGQAYMGFANYSWPGFGAVAQAAGRNVSVAFMGKGKLNKIAHPYPLVPAVPTVYASTKNIAVAGGPFRLTGSGFTAATAVSLAGAAATSFTVWSDSEITGVAAAHAAGSGLPATVTNAVGASAAANVVTYA